MFNRKRQFGPRRSLVEILIVVAISLIVAFGVGTFSYMMLNSCDGFYVRDAMGVPRCLHNPNVNVLVR